MDLYLACVPCANTVEVAQGVFDPCNKPADNSCQACRLVQYCSAYCQKQHWPLHKVSCKSSLLRTSWKPAWYIEQRKPSWITNDSVRAVSYGVPKYLWGNVPAFDLLNFKENEGNGLPSELSFLFAASGNLRNVMQTVNGLPSEYIGTLRIVINDKELDIVARNIIILMIVLYYDSDVAPSMMLHVWYSASLPQDLVSRLASDILPLVQEVCSKISMKSPDSYQAKTWHFQDRQLRVVLQRSQWMSLLSYFQIPAGLSASRANELRIAVTMAPSRVDHVHRYLYDLPPGKRMSFSKFREDGILLPFGASRREFIVPNPTFFQDAEHWPLPDSASPWDEWSKIAVTKKTPLANNDNLGALYLHILTCFRDFHSTLKRTRIEFTLLQVNALRLPSMLESSSMHRHTFDRIEVSNIIDGGYLGLEPTLSTLGPLLKRKSQNTHATLVGVFLNAIHEITTTADEICNMMTEIAQVKRYLPFNTAALAARDMSDPDILKVMAAKELFRDYDMLFARYMSRVDFANCAKKGGLKMKEEKMQSIMPPWPLRLIKKKGKTNEKENPTQAEFDDLIASGHTGHERYMEWECCDEDDIV